MKKIVIASIAAVIIASTSAGVFSLNQRQPEPQPAKATIEESVEQTKTEAVTAPEVQAEAAQVEQPAPTPVAPTPAPAPQPQSYAFAAEMSAAGIAAADQKRATEMLLDASGWRLQGHQWQKAQSLANVDLTTALAYANNYVVTHYGDWPTAHNLWVQAGNF